MTDGLTLAPPAPPASNSNDNGNGFETLGNTSWWQAHWCACYCFLLPEFHFLLMAGSNAVAPGVRASQQTNLLQHHKHLQGHCAYVMMLSFFMLVLKSQVEHAKSNVSQSVQGCKWWLVVAVLLVLALSSTPLVRSFPAFHQIPAVEHHISLDA